MTYAFTQDPHSRVEGSSGKDKNQMFRFARVDEHVCVSGHSYLLCDANCGVTQRHSRAYSVISDIDDWEGIMRENTKNCVTRLEQPLHRDMTAYLQQYFVNPSRWIDT